MSSPDTTRVPLAIRSTNFQNIPLKEAKSTVDSINAPKRSLELTPTRNASTNIHFSLRNSAKRICRDDSLKTKLFQQPQLLQAARKRPVSQDQPTLAQWQKQLRAAFKKFHFYFDAVDANVQHDITKKIQSLDGHIERFFSATVSHVVTTRPIPVIEDLEDKTPEDLKGLETHKEQPQSRTLLNGGLLDLAAKHQSNVLRSQRLSNALDSAKGLRRLQSSANANLREMYTKGNKIDESDLLVKSLRMGKKVWSLDKLVNKILANLIESKLKPSPAETNLSNLLREEKVYGTRERDPNVPRVDFIYFKGPYILVRDLNELHRPIMVREYSRPASGRNVDGEWPQFRATSVGRCPFVKESKSRPVIPKPEPSKRHVFPKDSIETLAVPNKGDVNASGIVQSQTTSAILSQPFKSAGASQILVATSKQVNDLKRKMFAGKVEKKKPQPRKREEARKVKIESKPGYCENCREHYDCLDDHAQSKTHRQFAMNNDNFIELDELLAKLKRPQKMYIELCVSRNEIVAPVTFCKQIFRLPILADIKSGKAVASRIAVAMLGANAVECSSLLSKRFGKERAANLFSFNPLNRFSFLRTDTSFLKSILYHPSTRFLTLRKLNPPVKLDSGKLCYLKYDDVKDVIGPKRYDNEYGEKDEAILIFLGIDEEFRSDVSKGDAYFALDISLYDNVVERVEAAGAKYQSLGLLKQEDTGIVALARSMIDWNMRNKLCPTCGCQTVSAWGGYKRFCPPGDPRVVSNAKLPEAQRPLCTNRDGLHNFEYPRTDMSVIVAVLCKDGTKVLLGRQRQWPRGFYSCLAGFIEPGETVEDAVRREVWEESGVLVGRVMYHSSQPWPYPSQLMIGCIAHSINDTIDLRNDPELEYARFFDKSEISEALIHRAYMRGDPASSSVPEDALKLPPKTAIAHSILKSIVEDDWGISKI